MSRKFIIILITSVLLLLFVSLIGYYFIIQGNGGGDGTSKPFSFRSFLPFGGEDNPTPTEETPTEEIPTENNPGNSSQNDFTNKLRKISSEPVAGAGVVEIKAGSIVRYIEKATGHIFETELFSPRNERISNTTIPLVYDAIWTKSASSTVARYLADDDVTVNTYSITLKNMSTSTENTLSGTAFPGNISDVAIFENSVFYLEQSANFSQGYTSNIDGSKKKLIWSSEIKELNPQYVNSKIVALVTKPKESAPGFLYFVDTNTGATRKVLGNVMGLSALVDELGSQVLYLQQSGVVFLSVLNIKSNITQKISPETFPEKCVWSKKDVNIVYCAVPKFPIISRNLTEWYKGLFTTEDDIWKYNIKENVSSIVANLSVEGGEVIDVIKPILSQNEQYLVFINKKDNSLWSLDLTK